MYWSVGMPKNTHISKNEPRTKNDCKNYRNRRNAFVDFRKSWKNNKLSYCYVYFSTWWADGCWTTVTNVNRSIIRTILRLWGYVTTIANKIYIPIVILVGNFHFNAFHYSFLCYVNFIVIKDRHRERRMSNRISDFSEISAFVLIITVNIIINFLYIGSSIVNVYV